MPAPTLSLVSSVTINEPAPNAAVGSPFPANGTFALSPPTADGYVMWQVQPADEPPSPGGWQPTASAAAGGTDRDRSQAPGRRWECSAAAAAGERTFYAAAFKTGSHTPAAVASVNITVS